MVDLLASLAALTGAVVPDDRAVDSRNLLDVLMGTSSIGREHLVQQGVNMHALLNCYRFVGHGE